MATEADGLAPGSLERFWAWWGTARDRVAAAIDRQTLSKHITQEITNVVDSMHPSLIWELGPGRSSRHALTLTPEGDLSIRRLTAAWLRSAPPPDEAWEYHAARQPAPDRDLEIGGHEFASSDFRIAYEYDEGHERFHVALHHPAFDGIREEVRRQVTFLALDQFLGEDEVERWLGAVDVGPGMPTEAVTLDEFKAEVERRRAQATGHRFSLGHGLDERGSTAVVMFNTALKQIDNLDHVFHLAVYFRIHEPRPDGLPSAEEAEQLNEVEDRLLELLGDNALHIGRLTLAARREVHLYVRDPEAAEQSLAEWRTHADAWGVNHAIRPDPAWSFSEDGFYRPLAPREA
jgi:Family of unknown function (DUF695)